MDSARHALRAQRTALIRATRQHEILLSDEINLIEIPRQAKGFIVLFESGLPLLEIKERTLSCGRGFNQKSILRSGLNYFCLCNLRKNSPTTRIFLLPNKEGIQEIVDFSYKDFVVLKIYEPPSFTPNELNYQWTGYTTFRAKLDMIGNNLHYPYDEFKSCEDETHTWHTLEKM